jgi:hypothetical protein
MRDQFTQAMQVATQALEKQLTAKKLRGLSREEAAQNIAKRLSNMRKVLLIKPKVKETPQKEPVTKFYDLKEDPQRRISKEDWTVFSKRIAE